MFNLTKHKLGALLLGLALVLTGCGGSSDRGGFTNPIDVVAVQVRTADGSNQVDADLGLDDCGLETSKTVIVELFDQEGQFVAAESVSVDVVPGSADGVLCTPFPPGEQADPEEVAAGNICAVRGLDGPFSRAVFEASTGIESMLFLSSGPGNVQLVASTTDPNSGQQVSGTLELEVVQTIPIAPAVTSMAFTGPFVNAVLAGQNNLGLQEGENILQDGSYQRLLSIVANDENGNPPVCTGRLFDFFAIDGPLVGYPAQGPGSFAIAGANGDPEEGGVTFRVPTGTGGFNDAIINGPAVRPLNDRLILDGRQVQNPGSSPQPNNRIFTGIWRVEQVLTDDALTIEQNLSTADRATPPFPFNPAVTDSGTTVPYLIGSALNSNILATGIAGEPGAPSAGVASTILTYPTSRIGQTAALMACTAFPQDLNQDGRITFGSADRKVCAVLNTCDANGSNCGSVFLPATDGSDIILTADPTVLSANSTSDVTLCLRDRNSTPLLGTPISYNFDSNLGAASVTINGNPASSGSLVTGTDGCVVATVASSGQAPDTESILITFDADNANPENAVTVEIRSPGAGNLTASLDCGGQVCIDRSGDPEPLSCTIDLLLTDGRGGPIPEVPITHTTSTSTSTVPLLEIAYAPPSGNFGITDQGGSNAVSVSASTEVELPTITFAAGAATTDVSLDLPDCGTDGEPPPTGQPIASLVGGTGGAVTLAPGGSTTLGVSLDQAASSNLTVNLLTTGATGQFTVPASVPIPAGQSSASFTVTAAEAPAGTSIEIRLSGGTGYTVGASSSITVAIGSDTGPEAPVDSIVLLANNTQLPSAGNPITLTAFVRDENNVLMEGVDVTFAADNDGTLRVIRGTTDESGTAQAELSTAANRSNRTINATASVGEIEDTVLIQVVGTAITISGRNSAVLGENLPLTLSLRDSAGNGLGGETLDVDFPDGDILTDANPVTNSLGQALVTLGLTTAGESTVTVTGAGAMATFTINVAAESFTFVEPEPLTDVALTEAQTLTVLWESAGAPVQGQSVDFTATRGTLSASSALTDANGEASVTISASSAGPSVITATTSTGITAELEILFVATVADTLTLQATPAVIGTNAVGQDAEQSEIIAVVRDPNGNLVKDKTVNFNLAQDVTGGTLSSSSGVTDAFGRTSVTYIAGTSPSARDGVRIDAVVADTPSITNTVFLTVAQRSLFITLGTGNEIEEPDAVRYAKPYGVLVTDAAGNPVSNAQVTISIWPTAYYKGFWERDLRFDPPPWIQVITAGPCANEDVNRDGILDPGEDFNINTVLDPGNVVTLSAANLTTDSTGFADFNLVYFQQFAAWVDVELTARATVTGSEATEIVNFRLPIAASDVAGGAPNPPGNPSPFGQSATCADTN